MLADKISKYSLFREFAALTQLLDWTAIAAIFALLAWVTTLAVATQGRRQNFRKEAVFLRCAAEIFHDLCSTANNIDHIIAKGIVTHQACSIILKSMKLLHLENRLDSLLVIEFPDTESMLIFESGRIDAKGIIHILKTCRNDPATGFDRENFTTNIDQLSGHALRLRTMAKNLNNRWF